MSQNSQRLQWSTEEVDEKLKGIMKSIYTAADSSAKEYKVSLQVRVQTMRHHENHEKNQMEALLPLQTCSEPTCSLWLDHAAGTA